MARPSDQYPLESPGYYPGLDSPRPSPHDPDARNETAIAHDQIAVLTDQLKGICQTIHPVSQNLTVYGHEIRNLLILASTEVEALWRGILTVNHASPSGRDFTTRDYVKLVPALKAARIRCTLRRVSVDEYYKAIRDVGINHSSY
jgi:hypothetical protein